MTQPVQPMEIARGTKIDRYVVSDELGRGGFGAVYKARDEERGTPVAIKVSAPAEHGSGPAQNIRRFTDQQNEIEALIRLSHPSIVEYKRCGQLPDGRIYIVMELALGLSLAERVAERKFEIIEAIRITQKIADAVAYSHECGILHLDIKPQNIILVDFIDPLDPKIKVLDFGLARLTRSHQQTTGHSAGTVAYMPPEAFSGAAPDMRFDTYAIGTVLYEMITGALPFQGNTMPEIVRSKMFGEPIPLAEVCPHAPEPLVHLVDSLLARDPNHRLADARALAERLRALYFGAFGSTSPHVHAHEARAPEARAAAAAEAMFIGRGRELDLLLQRFADVEKGRGHLVIVEGDAGIGKSRLVSEVLASRAVRSKALLGYGRCRQIGFEVPFSAIREALGQLADTVRTATGGAGEQLRAAAQRTLEGESQLLLKIVPELSALLSSAIHVPDRATRMMGPRHIALAINDLLSSLAKIQPVVLVLEDLHWADEGTRSMQAELSELPVPIGVLLLGTQRPQGEDAVKMQAEILALSPLDPAASDAQLRALLHGCSDEVLEKMKAAVPLLRVGNPLCNIHVVRNLVASGIVTIAADGSYSLAEGAGAKVAVPDTIAAALEATINSLPPAVRRSLAVAALFGRSFLASDLIALELQPREAIDEALAVAEANVLCTRDGDACLFVHDLIREQLERMNPPEELPTLHRHVALHLQQIPTTEASLLAHHYERADMPMEAGRASLTASKAAEDMVDPVGARTHLFRASRMFRRVPADAEGVRDELLTKTAHELSRVGSMQSSTDEVLEELRLCKAEVKEPTIPQTVTFDCALARHYYTRGEFVEALGLSQKSLAITSQRQDLAYLSLVPLNILGRALAASGQFGPAVATLTKGCTVAESMGEYLELSHSQGLLGVSLAFTGQYEQARAMAEVCYGTATQLRDPVRTAGAMFYRSVVADAEFDWQSGVDYSVRILRFCEEFTISGIYLQLGALMSGRHQFHMGNLRQAEVLLDNSLNLASVMGVKTSIGWAWAYRGDVLCAMGKYNEAIRSYTNGLDPEKKRSKEDLAAGLGLGGLAHIEALTGGSFDNCVRLAEEAILRLTSVANVSMLVHTYQRYAESMELFGKPELAAPLWQKMHALMVKIGCRDADWWPEIGGGLPGPRVAEDWRALQARSEVRREYWQIMAQRELGSDPGQARIAATRPTEMPGTDLFVSLSTVHGYVPVYLAETEVLANAS
ncbi:MAG: protein kinase [Polyangiaceae bacterium]